MAARHFLMVLRVVALLRGAAGCQTPSGLGPTAVTEVLANADGKSEVVGCMFTACDGTVSYSMHALQPGQHTIELYSGSATPIQAVMKDGTPLNNCDGPELGRKRHFQQHVKSDRNSVAQGSFKDRHVHLRGLFSTSVGQTFVVRANHHNKQAVACGVIAKPHEKCKRQDMLPADKQALETAAIDAMAMRDPFAKQHRGAHIKDQPERQQSLPRNRMLSSGSNGQTHATRADKTRPQRRASGIGANNAPQKKAHGTKGRAHASRARKTLQQKQSKWR